MYVRMYERMYVRMYGSIKQISKIKKNLNNETDKAVPSIYIHNT